MMEAMLWVCHMPRTNEDSLLSRYPDLTGSAVSISVVLAKRTTRLLSMHADTRPAAPTASPSRSPSIRLTYVACPIIPGRRSLDKRTTYLAANSRISSRSASLQTGAL